MAVDGSQVFTLRMSAFLKDDFLRFGVGVEVFGLCLQFSADGKIFGVSGSRCEVLQVHPIHENLFELFNALLTPSADDLLLRLIKHGVVLLGNFMKRLRCVEFFQIKRLAERNDDF